MWGDSRPPLDEHENMRRAQVQAVAVSTLPCLWSNVQYLILRILSSPPQEFVQRIKHVDPNANIVVAGDFNDALTSTNVFEPLKGLLSEAAVATGMPQEEQYTFIHDQYSEGLDHIFLSPALGKSRDLRYEIVHINAMQARAQERTSDHDPIVVSFQLCDLDRVTFGDRHARMWHRPLMSKRHV